MMPVQWGVFVFASLSLVLLLTSVVRERQVSTDGAVGRGILAKGLTVVVAILLVLAGIVVVIRFAQIAIWE